MKSFLLSILAYIACKKMGKIYNFFPGNLSHLLVMRNEEFIKNKKHSIVQIEKSKIFLDELDFYWTNEKIMSAEKELRMPNTVERPLYATWQR